jgi:ligand-binding sensor domain-containing protein/serine phosphatase RsbU (regulator of sigma subunit)
MRYILSRKIVSSIVLCLILSSSILKGQVYQFKNYGAGSKIPNNFIYTLNQDNRGYIWIGTGSGLARFDGFNFYNTVFPDSAQGRYPVSSLKDKNGNLWFGCNDGTVFRTEEGVLKAVILKNSKSVSAIVEGPDGFIYIVPQGGALFRVSSQDPGKIMTYPVDQNLTFFSACFTRTGNLLIGTMENIIIGKPDENSFTILKTIEGFDYSRILAIKKIKDKDTYIIGTDGNGLFKLVLSPEGDHITRFSNHSELENITVQSITEDADGDFWIPTNGKGVLKLGLSGNDETVRSSDFIDKSSGLPGNNAGIVLQDNEGNYWIGLFGDGLSLLNSLAFRFYSPGANPGASNIIYAHKLYNDYFLGTPYGYYMLDLQNNRVLSYTDLLQKTGKNEIASYCVDKENNTWIGTKGGGLYVRNAAGNLQLFRKTGNSGEDFISDVEADNKYVWLGTLDGLIILDRETKNLKAKYTINNGLPHNSINKIYLTSKGTAAVATKTDRLYLIDPENGVIAGKAIMYGTTMNEIIAFCETADGSLWASTAGNGVFEFYGDSLRSFSRSDQLMSDYCYSILADSLNRIWVGHERGFSRYDLNAGVMRTFETVFAKGGSCNPDGMYESPDGKVLIGTTEGVIVYDRFKDKKPRMAPVTNINFITVNDSTYPYQPSFVLPYSKRYKIAVNYVGINFSNPEKVYYLTRLDNWDEEWSKLSSDREVLYSPRDGHYKFNVRSIDDEGYSQDSPVSFELTIKKPFWRTGWFIASVIALLTGIIVLIVREREKAQKRIRIYLEKELEARTSVVMKQKGELELQNIEITDSINYAKRIQTSILPDFSKVKDIFPEAFLFFRPRDIVSGDFYWFDRFEDEKFMLVCADSTGHGVPGAFMSMIGSTLLQDIVTRQRISRPSVIMKMLDKQIFSTLNQNIELGVSNDGMDMVICEINIKTRHIRFASAMRPVIFLLGGEPLYVKGNRYSVGGESVMEKYFDDQEYYLKPGDTLYLFSDGLPDQFGGKDGKKMKIARLKKLIEDIAGLAMEGQKEVIMNFFDEWKGDFDQVDDILMMGIRL